jgi:hypothetical protein
MQLPSRSRPVIASFAAGAVALLPLLLVVLAEINAEPAHVDDAGTRSAALVLLAAPFLYLIVVPICYVVGSIFVRLRFLSLARFVTGAAVLALVAGFGLGLMIASPSRFGVRALLISIAASSSLALVAALPAAFCWWLLAVRTHNLLLQRTTAPPAELARYADH